MLKGVAYDGKDQITSESDRNFIYVSCGSSSLMFRNDVNSTVHTFNSAVCDDVPIGKSAYLE